MRHLAFLLGILLAQTGFAEPVSEYAMKASYLYNFSLFVEWPQPEGEDFNVCLLGYENFGRAANAIEGKLVRGRPLVVARLSTLSALRRCQVLFISEREGGRLRSILRELGDEPVLTVSEVRDAPGTMISFYPEDGRLVFEVNNQRARSVGLNISSKLLQLAKTVR